MLKTFAIFSFVFASFASESDVHVLTESNFDEFIKTHPKSLVEFYAPWCGHCKQLAPEYEKAATKLKDSNVNLCKVDATEEKSLASRFEVNGYPTLLWFPDGLESEDYGGARTADGIVEWVKMMTSPPVTTVETLQEPTTKAVITLHSRTLLEHFKAFAASNRKFAVAFYIESDTQKLTIQHKNEAVIETTDVSIIESASKLEEFWHENSYPLFGLLDGDSHARYMEREKFGIVWSLFPMKSSDEFETVISKERPMMTKIAKMYPNYSFTYIDTVQYTQAIKEMLGVTEFPALIAFKKVKDKAKYVFKDEMTEEALIAFFAGVEDGSVEPTLQTEEIPASNDEPVRVIVGQTMESELFQSDKDVLLEIYAPWCGHCKNLEPEYLKVAKKILKEGVEDMVVLAKMDGTANDPHVDSITWTGFPTMYYVKAGEKEPMAYDGPRTAKGIWKWIKKNHSKADELSTRIKANKDTKEKEEL